MTYTEGGQYSGNSVNSSVFKSLAGFFTRSPRQLTLQGATAAVRPYVTARLWRKLRRPILLVTPNAEEAEKFWEELTFYLPSHAEILHYPAWEVLPFEPLSR